MKTYKATLKTTTSVLKEVTVQCDTKSQAWHNIMNNAKREDPNARYIISDIKEIETSKSEIIQTEPTPSIPEQTPQEPNQVTTPPSQ